MIIVDPDRQDLFRKNCVLDDIILVKILIVIGIFTVNELDNLSVELKSMLS